MSLDHAAIRKAYPNVTLIDDTGSVIKDASGNTIAVEQSKIDEARTAIDAEEACEKFCHYLYDPQYKIVGHNLLGFDVYVVKTLIHLVGHIFSYSFINRIIDTRSIATAIAKDIPVDRENFLAWQYKLINYKERGLRTAQGFLLKKYDIPHDPKKLHDALYDIIMNYEIFRKQLYEIEL